MLTLIWVFSHWTWRCLICGISGVDSGHASSLCGPGGPYCGAGGPYTPLCSSGKLAESNGASDVASYFVDKVKKEKDSTWKKFFGALSNQGTRILYLFFLKAVVVNNIQWSWTTNLILFFFFQMNIYLENDTQLKNSITVISRAFVARVFRNMTNNDQFDFN